jgi:predicted metal-dependent TIM-barrel fold hydrolase
LDPRVGQILDLVASADAAIATSHLDFEESRALVEEARRRGVNKLVATHVRFVTASLSIEEQKWMAEKGVFLELCYSSLSPAWRSTTIDEVVEAIEEVGPEHYILASDLGQVHNPPPPEGLRIYVTMLLERGIEPDDIRVMVRDNPERLLGLDG